MPEMQENAKFITALENAIDAESTLSNCCAHLSSLIDNGRIRKEFTNFSEIARINVKVLSEYMQQKHLPPFVLENKCKYCKMKPESFSLAGAIGLGLEITQAIEALYKDLAKNSPDETSKALFDNLRRGKIQQRNFFKKEKTFIKEEEKLPTIINEYCIPEVAAKLWK